MSSSHQAITYNNHDRQALWRCHRYLLRHGYIYPIVGGTVFIALVTLMLLNYPIGPMDLALLGALVFLMPILSMNNLVRSLVKERRDCTTTITEFGVNDRTERMKEISLPWKKISSVRIDDGNVYFIAPLASVYVPSYAFPDSETAHQFYAHALTMWNAARNKTLAAKITAHEDVLNLEADTLAQIENYETQEEAMWRELEEQHRKENEDK